MKQTLNGAWSVRQLENYLRNNSSSKKSVNTTTAKSDSEIQLDKITKELSKSFGTKVTIKRDQAGKGQFIIKFTNDKEFNSIYDILTDLD